MEPNPADPLASTKRHRDEAAAAAGMLPTVDEKPRWGLLTKTHLFLALLCLQSGRIRKDSYPSETWTLPPDDGTGKHKHLYEVIARGLNVVILDASI